MNAVAHNLRFNGAAFDSEGELINSDTKVTAGAGRAKCSCGWLSDHLANGSQRRKSFRDHKAEAPVVQPEPMFTDEELALADRDLARQGMFDDIRAEEDLIGLSGLQVEEELGFKPVPETEEAPAPVKKAPKAKQPLKVRRQVEGTEPNAYSASIPFTTAVADSMWRFLGRAAVTVVDELHPTVQAKADNNGHIVRLSGPKDDVRQAELTVKEFWMEAIDAVKAWKATDKGWAARPKGGLVGRKASYFMTGDFYVGYADTFVAAVNDRQDP